MCQFVKNSFKATLGLTSALILLIALQAQAAASETTKPGAFLLAQSAEPQKEQKKSPKAASVQEEEKLKQEKSREEKMQMEKQAPKTRGPQSAPAATGTKKIGGQIIRDKESPDGE